MKRGGRRGGKRGEVVIQHRRRPPGRGPSGCGDELDCQPVEEQPKARRLVFCVKVCRQLARLHNVRDARGERFLKPPRGALGSVGQRDPGR